MITRRDHTFASHRPEQIPAPGFETYVMTGKTSDGLKLDVAVTQNETDTSIPDIIVTQPWSGFVDRPPVRGTYLPTLATAFGARVIAIDNLGLGRGTDNIPQSMHRDLRRGNFDPLATTQWEVLTDSVPDLHEQLVHFGYSQGATVSAWLAKNSPETHATSDLMLMEAVGLQPQSFLRLVGRGAIESAQWRIDYQAPLQAQKRSSGAKPLPAGDLSAFRRMRRDLSGLYDYPRGLTHARILGALATALEQGSLTPATHMAIVNTSNSRLSTTPQNDLFAQQLAETGYENIDRITVRGHSHGMIDDPAAMYAFLDDYRQRASAPVIPA